MFTGRIHSILVLLTMLSTRFFVSAFKTASRRNVPTFGSTFARFMATDVYVGNLPNSLSEDEVRNILSQKLSSSFDKFRLIQDKITGQSRGFGYVTFEEEDAANAALSSLNGVEIEGRTIKVDIAGAKRERTPAGGEGRGTGTDTKSSIYIGNLDFSTTAEDVKAFVAKEFGDAAINDVRLATDRMTGRSRGFAHVEFSDASTVEQAISKLNGQELSGRAIRVDSAQQKDRTAAPRDGGAYGAGSSAPRRNNANSVFVGNLAWTVDEALIREMVTDVVGQGSFTNVRVAVDPATGRSRGFAHVDFVDSTTASRAIQMLNNLEVEGRQIRADTAGAKVGGPGGGDRGDRRGGPGGPRGGPRGGDRYGDNQKSNDGYENW